jgi:hypothetical protein
MLVGGFPCVIWGQEVDGRFTMTRLIGFRLIGCKGIGRLSDRN